MSEPQRERIVEELIRCAFCGHAEYVVNGDWKRAIARRGDHEAQCPSNPDGPGHPLHGHLQPVAEASAAAQETKQDDLGLSIDMLDADRLRDWAHNIETFGPDITQWGQRDFMAQKLRELSESVAQAVRDIGVFRSSLENRSVECGSCGRQFSCNRCPECAGRYRDERAEGYKADAAAWRERAMQSQDFVAICERCQMRLPERLVTFSVGVRGGTAARCAACAPQDGPDGEAKRQEVIALRRARLRPVAASAGTAPQEEPCWECQTSDDDEPCAKHRQVKP